MALVPIDEPVKRRLVPIDEPAPALGKSLVGQLAQPFIDNAAKTVASALPTITNTPPGLPTPFTAGTQPTVQALPEEAGLLQTGVKLATQPFVDLPRLKAEDVSGAFGGKGEPGATSKVAAGAQNAVMDLVDFFQSPLGIATMGSEGMPAAAQKLVQYAFAADMTRSLPPQFNEFWQAAKKGDIQGATRHGISLGLTPVFITETLRHAAGGPPSDGAAEFTPADARSATMDMRTERRLREIGERAPIVQAGEQRQQAVAQQKIGESKAKIQAEQERTQALERERGDLGEQQAVNPAVLSAQAIEQQLGAAEAANKSPQAAEALKARLAAEAAQPAPQKPKPPTPTEQLTASIAALIDEKLKASGVKLPETPVAAESLPSDLSTVVDKIEPPKIEGEPAKAGTEQKQPVPQPAPSAEVAPKPPTPAPGAPVPPQASPNETLASQDTGTGATKRQGILSDLSSGKVEHAVGETAETVAIWDMMNTLHLPAGWKIKDVIPSKYGSAYWQIEDRDGDTHKVTVRDHAPSPMREQEFGASDFHEYVKNANDPVQFHEGMTALEKRLAQLDAKLPEFKHLQQEAATEQYRKKQELIAEKNTIEALEKDLTDREESLKRGIRYGNGKPITTENQRQISQQGIEAARQKLAMAKSAQPPAPPTAAAKEPWLLTRAEWLSMDKTIWGDLSAEGTGLNAVKKFHEITVRDAIRDGKPVPPEVLADYPDLQKPTEAPAPVVERKPAMAAYRDPKTKKIETGKSHAEILERLGRKVPKDRSADRFGFVDADGKWMTRDEAGYATGKAAGDLHSHELQKWLTKTKPKGPGYDVTKGGVRHFADEVLAGGVKIKLTDQDIANHGAEAIRRLRQGPLRDMIDNEKGSPLDVVAAHYDVDAGEFLEQAEASKMKKTTLEAQMKKRDAMEEARAKAELEQYEADRKAENANGKKLDDSFDVSEFEPKPAAEPLTLESPTAEQLRTEERLREQKAKIEKLQDKPLKGTAGEIGQTLMPGEESANPLFTPKAKLPAEIQKFKDAGRLEIIPVGEPTIFTKAAKDAAVERLKKRGQQMGAGVDPGYLRDLVEIGGHHVEKGIRTFAAWSKQMTQELGERVRPYLRETWKRLQHDERYKDITKASKVPSDREAGQMVKAFTEPKSGERTKAIAERSTGISDRIADVVTQAEALRGSLAAEARGATGGAKQMKRDVSSVAKEANSRVAEIRDGLLAHVDQAMGDKGAKEYRKIITRVMKPIDPTRFVGRPEAMTKMLHDRMKAAQLIVEMTNEKATTIARKDASALIRKLGGAAVKSESVSVGVKPTLRDIINSDHRSLSTPALLTLAERTRELVNLGKVTEAMRKQMLQKRRADLEARFGTEKAGAHPLESHPILRPQPGEALSFKERLANRLNTALNLRQRFGYAYPPINYVLDLMSARDYSDGLVKWLKGPVDLGYEDYTRTASKLTGDLDQKLKAWGIDDKSSSKIAAYAEYKQAGGLENLIEGGVEKRILDELEAKGDAFLTPNERRFYEYARERMDSQYPEVNTITQRLYNREMPKVDNYWPRLADWGKLSEMEVYDRLIDQRRRLSAKTAQGFTQQRTGGTMKVRLDAVSTFRRHMDDTAYYTTMQEDVHTLMQAVSGDKFKATYGDTGQFAVRQWLDAVAKRGGGDQGARRVKWIDYLSNNLNRAMTSYRPFSQMKHISNAGIAQAIIGPGWYTTGIASVFDPRWKQFMAEHAPSFQKRGGGDMYSAQGMKPIEYAVAQGSDRLNSTACFLGAYQKLLHEKGITIPESGPIPVDKETLATALVYSHGATASVFTKDLPLMRSQGALSGNVTLDRALSVFQGYLMERYGYFKRDFVALGIQEKDAGQAVKAASGLLLAAAIHIGVVSLGAYSMKKAGDAVKQSMTGKEPKPPKHDPLTPEALSEEYIIDLMKNVAPLAGNVVTAFKFGGSGVPVIDEIARGAKDIHNLYAYTTPIAKAKAGLDVAEFGLAAAGVPGSGQAMQLIRKSIPDAEREKKKKSLAELYQ